MSLHLGVLICFCVWLSNYYLYFYYVIKLPQNTLLPHGGFIISSMEAWVLYQRRRASILYLAPLVMCSSG